MVRFVKVRFTLLCLLCCGVGVAASAAAAEGDLPFVRMHTEAGDILLVLYPDLAPHHVAQFLYLSESGFYEETYFHRIMPGFIIQGGDPKGTGSGGPGYTTPAEIGRKHTKGALAWARTGDRVNPQRRSSGSQFYITLAPTPNLDGAYTVFGQTTKGMDVVEKIKRGDKIESITIRAE